MAKERECIFCGKSYLYCPNCKEYNKYPTWMASFDSEKCHDLYKVIGGYNIGVKTKEDVKAVLDKHNIIDYSEFSEKLQNKLTAMFKVTTISSPVEETSPIEDESITEEIVIPETVVVEKTKLFENTVSEEPDQIDEKYNRQRSRRLRRKNYEKSANTEE